MRHFHRRGSCRSRDIRHFHRRGSCRYRDIRHFHHRGSCRSRDIRHFYHRGSCRKNICGHFPDHLCLKIMLHPARQQRFRLRNRALHQFLLLFNRLNLRRKGYHFVFLFTQRTVNDNLYKYCFHTKRQAIIIFTPNGKRPERPSSSKPRASERM